MEIEQKIHTLTIQTNRKRNSLAAILNRDEGGDALQTLENVDDLEQSEVKIKELKVRLEM